MRKMALKLAVIYLRLSVDEIVVDQAGKPMILNESGSISSQRLLIEQYCLRHGITIINEFSDDGFSGGNFMRPGFHAMLDFIAKNQVSHVITKDLSRLGRDMSESSRYAEQYFPERGIRFIAVNDNFDSEHDNPMAPFQFAMNEVYLRDGSKKVREVLKTKRQVGQYCACPPYGYAKDHRASKLIADEQTAHVVQLIFKLAARGESSRRIAEHLDSKGIIPPLKYRVLYRDNFGEKGAARVSDQWNWTTVKRILRNEVYLGHTLLGKTRKVSIKSEKKIELPEDEWTILHNTHEPLIAEEEFEMAQRNLAHNTRAYLNHPQVRKSIFGKVACCAKCGCAMSSGGSVYKGEREKYWYLVCNNMRRKDEKRCEGTRIRYYDLLELVRQDINQFLSLSHEELTTLAHEADQAKRKEHGYKSAAVQLQAARDRILAIDKIVGKLYADNAAGKIADDRLERMVGDLEKESAGLQQQEKALSCAAQEHQQQFSRVDAFYQLAQRYSHIEVLDRETLLTFVDRIEIGPKRLPEGNKLANQHVEYQQEITIHYKFIGTLATQECLREVKRAAGG